MGSVPNFSADVDDLMKDVGFKPAMLVEEGIGNFVGWYRLYFSGRSATFSCPDTCD